MHTVADVQTVAGTSLRFVGSMPLQTFGIRPAEPTPRICAPAVEFATRPRRPKRRLRENIIDCGDIPEPEDEPNRLHRTLEEVAERLGISKQRVKQLEEKALAKLRVALSQPIDRDPLLPGMHFQQAYGIRQRDLHAARKAGLLVGELRERNWWFRESAVAAWRAGKAP